MTSKKTRKTKKIQSLPVEIIRNLLLFVKPSSLFPLLDSAKVCACLEDNNMFWNSYSGIYGECVCMCKGMLKKERRLVRMIRDSLETTRTFKTYQSDMTQLLFKDNIIYCSSDDQTVKAFRITGELYKKFIGHSGGVWAIDVADDYLITGSTDKSGRIWSINHGISLHVLRFHRSTVRAVKIYKDYIITASRDGTIGIWKKDGSLHRMLHGHFQSVRCIDINEKYLVSGSYDCIVKAWDYRRGKFLKDVAVHKRRVYCVKVFGDYVASSGQDFEVKVTCLRDKRASGHSLHTLIVLWIDFYGRYVITSGLDGYIIKYDYINKKVGFWIKESTSIKHQKVHNNLLLIATVNEAKLYSLRSGKLIRVLLSAYLITHVDMTNDVILIGYSYGGAHHITVFDYTQSKPK